MAERPPRILLVDDEQAILTLLSYPLQQDGYEVVRASDGVEALARFAETEFELVVLDVTMPHLDGLEVCKRLRASSSVPIIMLTAKTEEIDKVLGLELGADDYITKPFATRELVARVKAVLRRFERPTTPSIIRFEEVIIDQGAMQLKVRGELTTTTATEFRLLDYLARHPGRVYSRDHLLDSVWGDARFVTPRSVDVYVRRIREKIEVDPENPRYLKTVRGAGYRFEMPKSE